MGGILSAEMRLYGRRKDNEKYVDLGKTSMCGFKHAVCAYAMDRKHTDMKSIYVYDGVSRAGKAHLRGVYLELTFDSLERANDWDTSEERVDDVAWLFRRFDQTWNPVQTDAGYKRVYKRK